MRVRAEHQQAQSPAMADPSRAGWLHVTAPLVPDPDRLAELLGDVIRSGRLTNGGPLVERLEQELAVRLRVPDLAAVTSGTAGLELAMKALVPPGEVVTTAYSHASTWSPLLDDSRWTPVFVDIDQGFCLDPAAVAAAITPRTSAILGVHTYGAPCDHDSLGPLARKHGIALVYDAAACFGVELGGSGIGSLGDLSVFSFHATKVFNTVEGGAVTGQPEHLAAVRRRRSAQLLHARGGLTAGQNAKLDEVRAAFGLLNLPLVERALARRKAVSEWYMDRLSALDVDELKLCLPRLQRPGVSLNYSYFPVLVRSGGLVDRDGLCAVLQRHRILPRTYFSETVPTSPLFDGMYRPGSLPRTDAASRQVLCLPLHHLMDEDDCGRVLTAVAEAFGVPVPGG